MDIHLTSDQAAFARRAIAMGRLHSEEDAVQEAMALWEERERQRLELQASLAYAKASVARGEGRELTRESMRQMSLDIRERGMARLAAEMPQRR
jgi:Arc/MetJ-type ribon-helix-helix transcriptional regulator